MSEAGKIKCMIVDDEPPAVETLRAYVASVSSLQLEAVAYNAIEASNLLRTHPIDLLFLDIQMPHLLGTDLVRTLKHPPSVIFTTAYRKFAIDGFELDAVDYLLKPISFERFLKSVNKVIHNRPVAAIVQPGNSFPEALIANQYQPQHKQPHQPHQPNQQQPQLNQYHQPQHLTHQPHQQPFINLRVDRKNLKVHLDEILFIESLKDYVKVITSTKVIITKQSISSLEEILQGQNFLRIHRSYLVSLNKIDSFTNNLIGIGKHELPISRMYRLDVEKQLYRQ